MGAASTLNYPNELARPKLEYSPPAESSGQPLLEKLLATLFIRPTDWKNLADEVRDELQRAGNREELLAQLVSQNLLTPYQAERIIAGTTFGLILGNYRVLDRLGVGGMGVVFKAEHLYLPRLVAIKVLPPSASQDPQLVERFLSEMWTTAKLQHPNIVSAVDAGETAGPDPDSAILRYFAMDFVAGSDLEEHVKAKGPLSPEEACDLIHQIASALSEAAKHGLVHRDIKPSNILVTPERQAKLLDFGLARDFRNRLTEPGTILGTVEFVAPEQVRDASAVDIRADIYGLGGTLFWCLTARAPFPSQGDSALDLSRRLTQPPPSARKWRPDLPAKLDTVLSRMMAADPDDRYATPEMVMRALLPFLDRGSRDSIILASDQSSSSQGLALGQDGIEISRIHHVLLVDDEPAVRTICRHALDSEGMQCDEAANGIIALDAIKAKRYDLAVLDIDMPAMTGPEVLRHLREAPPTANFKVIMVSGRASADELAQMLSAGADDYLAKPLSLLQFQSRVKAALRLKDAQDRSDVLTRNLLALNHELEQNLTARDSDLVHARNALVLALAEMVAYRDSNTGAHLVRLQNYSRCLAEEAASYPGFAGQIDGSFVRMLECCAPLHDIGKVGLPDHILLKPGKLDADERILMQTHTTIGADTLQKVAKQHPFAAAFLQMAIDIARHHHERCDGNGYPDRLAGNDIPLAARIVAIADVYDALRTRRPYKPALSHAAAMQVMIHTSEGQFDPLLLEAFKRCASSFERIAREVRE